MTNDRDKTGIRCARAASTEIARVLDAPALATVDLSHRGALVQLWNHGALHATTHPMSDHVFMTYSGVPRAIERRTGGRRVRTRTKPNSITLIPAGDESRWDIAGSIQAVHFYVSESRLNSFAEQAMNSGPVTLLERTASTDSIGGQLLTLLAEEMNSTRPLSRLFVEQMSDLLCLHMVREHSSAHSEGVPVARGGLAGWQVKRITDYLEHHLADDVSLADLSALIGLSTFHLCRAFKQSTGVPPYRWRALRRIERARELLDGTQAPITEIAAEVGYDDPGQFAGNFRRATGMSPSEYRRLRKR